jgi:hypothetical protein
MFDSFHKRYDQGQTNKARPLVAQPTLAVDALQGWSICSGLLHTIDHFLVSAAAMPQAPLETSELACSLVSKIEKKLTLLVDGKYWQSGVSETSEALILRHYKSIDAFLLHQRQVAFPDFYSRDGTPRQASDVPTPHPFSLAVLRHLASDSVRAIDLSPYELPAVYHDEFSVYPAIAFGTFFGISHSIFNFLSPRWRYETLLHEGAHHLLFSLAASGNDCPTWLKNSLKTAPKLRYASTDLQQNNHATLYAEVLANYVVSKGDPAAAVRKTASTYPSEWKNQFTERFPIARKISPEALIAGLQQLTERYPAATWSQLQALEYNNSAISQLLAAPQSTTGR